ncbi:HsdM family class I SAM-dependent methyltransferase [Micromonospora zamorensis]|uniref:HsdM family class I SAM-dependent methyltransferase n=1 Tax=Micromonospora zamorensis TaxID=709883 RepID=UPI0033B2881C
MPTNGPPASGLLESVYEGLGLDEGRLLKPAEQPSDETQADWRSIGDWLSLASRMKADRIFFVGDDPILVFSVMPDKATERDFIEAYRQAWSLSRPRCLFLACGTELRVYSLSAPPPATIAEWQALTPLEVVERTADVAETLANFRRDRVESGATFDPAMFPDVGGPRADQQLVEDIGRVAHALRERGLPADIAHGLIERVILVRYLEDREVVTPDYLEQVAQLRPSWADAFTEDISSRFFGQQSKFVSCLSSKSLTYAVFAQLEHEFNGDLFSVAAEERKVVTAEHLAYLQRLLTRDMNEAQQPLFLWAYDFSVVPTSLISSMYEHFYHLGEAGDDRSTHYTPPELVEFIVSNVLTPNQLDKDPRICDPACGSGVFLVEAYRAVIRHEMSKRKRRLTTSQLRRILLTRIAGIDINPEAVRLAAFSLYLAFLNYQTAKDIRQAGPLPRLIYRTGENDYPAVLAVSDAFAPTKNESEEALFDLPHRLSRGLPWPEHHFDVLIGNPPWDEPRGSSAMTAAERWAIRSGYPVGDRSPSQLFLWRSLSLMKPDGVAGLLVAASVFHNTRSTTKAFRRAWLDNVALEEIVNFSQARRLFFASAVAPFFFIRYRVVTEAEIPSLVSYSTVRPSVALQTTRSLAYGRVETHLVGQPALIQREYLWKVYAWGNHHDEALMSRLDLEKTIADVLPDDALHGYGYQRGRDEPSEVLGSLPSLKRFEPWGPVVPEWLEPPPSGVKRQPDERLYFGYRLLIRRGIKVGFGPLVRLEDQPLSFRHTTYCIPLTSMPKWQAELLFGILLSSLGRYRMFMTSGSWGIWHDSALAQDILGVPVRMYSRKHAAVSRCLELVRRLRQWRPPTTTTRDNQLSMAFLMSVPITFMAETETYYDILRLLDQAVYDLFELTSGERDLVEDWQRYLLPLAGGETSPRPTVKRERVHAVLPNRGIRTIGSPIGDYIDTFVGQWNRELAPDGSLTWEIVSNTAQSVIAAVFETRDLLEPAGQLTKGIDEQSLSRWNSALDKLDTTLKDHLTRKVAREGTVRVVGDSYIVIVKRNEDRLWSSSMAREDFEATLVQAMNLQAS